MYFIEKWQSKVIMVVLSVRYCFVCLTDSPMKQRAGTMKVKILLVARYFSLFADYFLHAFYYFLFLPHYFFFFSFSILHDFVFLRS